MLNDLLIDLYNLTGPLVPESSIFYSGMPDMPNECVSFTEYAGPGKHDSVSAIRGIQVTVRSVSQTTASQIAWRLYKKFAIPPWIDLPGGRYIMCQPKQTPFLMGRDSDNRIKYAFNMSITTQFD